MPFAVKRSLSEKVSGEYTLAMSIFYVKTIEKAGKWFGNRVNYVPHIPLIPFPQCIYNEMAYCYNLFNHNSF